MYTLKRSVSELLDPNPPQAALDLRNQPDAKRARTTVELEAPLPPPTLKSTTVEAPATPEREASQPSCPYAPRKIDLDEFAKTHTPAEVKIDLDEFAKTHTPAEVLKVFSQHYTMEDRVLETQNVGNHVIVTGVKKVIPFYSEASQVDEDELMTQHFEQTQAVETQAEESQVEETQQTQVTEETPVITALEEDDDGLVDQHAESMAEERSQTAWTKSSFDQAIAGGEDHYFRFETRDPKMTQFTEGGTWVGLSSLGLENMEVFMTTLREQFLTIPIAKEHGITMAHFENESVRIVGWAISDSMINF